MDAPISFELAERVAEAARELGIDTALIGGSALAAHNYIRATKDVDFATAVELRHLRSLEQALKARGLHTQVFMPDPSEDDDLGGIRVWENEDEQGEPLGLVEVVNFSNPYRPRSNPAVAAIRNALRVDEHTMLKYVQLPDLIALKLYAGNRKDLADIVEVLVANPNANLDEIRAVAGPYDRTSELETLIAEATLRHA